MADARARAADPRLHALAARGAATRLRPDHHRRLRPPLALVLRRPARLLAIDLGLVRGRIADAARQRARRRDDARRRMVPRRPGQLRAAPVSSRRPCPRRRPSRDRLSQRGDAATRRDARDRLARAAPPGRRAGGGIRPPRRRAGRSRRRLHAERAADGGRLPRRAPAWARCGRCARPTWGRSPCSTASARSSRCCSSRATATATAARSTIACRCWSSCSPSCRRCGTSSSGATSMAMPIAAGSPRPRGAPTTSTRSSRPRRRFRRAGSPSTIRSGSSTRAERPACRKRSCTAMAASCSSRSRPVRCTTTSAPAPTAATATTGTARPAGSCGIRSSARCSAARPSACTTAARPARTARCRAPIASSTGRRSGASLRRPASPSSAPARRSTRAA